MSVGIVKHFYSKCKSYRATCNLKGWDGQTLLITHVLLRWNGVQLWAMVRNARWHIFEPKIPIWVNFEGSYNGRCWYILQPLGLFYGHLVYFGATYIYGVIYSYLVYFSRFGTLYKKSGNPGYDNESYNLDNSHSPVSSEKMGPFSQQRFRLHDAI
jgi:hypothetical protein